MVVYGDTVRREGNSIETPSTLRSTFTFTRRARPPTKKSLEKEARVPLASDPTPPQLGHKGSKGGLRGMFTRTRVDIDPNISTLLEEDDFVPQGRRRSPPPNETSQKSPESHQSFMRPFPLRITTVSRSQSPDAPKRSAPKSPKTAKQPTKTNNKASVKQPARIPRRTDAAWDPPPLFQAYPQAIKHALLSASTLSADSIIRLSGHKQNSSISQDITRSGLGETKEQAAAAKKNEKAKSKHRRQISGSISKAEWTQKIFVLVTSGYLLQYSGDGSFDRLPEKMMQLGKDSVAFASDVIPGKHWVLQISQAMDSGGIPAPDARSLLSRLTFRGADYRRTATSLLLVLNSAEDMESWITTVRREIEALGGKKYVSETGKAKVDDKGMQLNSLPSHRYVIQRDPDRMSNPASPQTLTFKAPWDQSPERKSQDPMRPTHSPFTTIDQSERPSTERFSVATSVTSDGQHLDSLRESTLRLSYMSSGERTLLTSRGSSPTASPKRDTFLGRDEQEQSKGPMEETQSLPYSSAMSDRRRSMQTLQKPAFEFHTTNKAARQRPHSTYSGSGISVRIAQHHNQPMPNFSMTQSANQKSSLARIPDNAFQLRGKSVNSPTKPMEIPVKGNRKSPPAMLNSRALSPVKDQPSPPPIYTPSEATSRRWLDTRPTIIEIPARPRTSPQRELTDAERPNRFSSSAPLNSTAPSHVDSQFPPLRSSNSFQPLLSESEETLSSPVRPPHLPPGRAEVPELDLLPPSPPKEERLIHQNHATLIHEPPSIPLPTPPAKNPRRPASMQFSSTLTPKAASLFPSVNRTLTPIILRPSLKTNGPQSPPVSYRASGMQSKSASSTPTFTSPPTFSAPLSNNALPTPPLSSSLLSSSVQHASTENRAITNRRSMPQLVNGPPPAPPPNCALPPLPISERPPGLKPPSMKRMTVHSSVRA